LRPGQILSAVVVVAVSFAVVAGDRAAAFDRDELVNGWGAMRPDSFRASVVRIGLLPCEFPDDMRLRPRLAAPALAMRAQVDSLIARAITARRYEVLDAATVLPEWRRLTDSLGGRFDAASGTRDTSVSRRLASHLRALGATRWDVRVWLEPRVVHSTAMLKKGSAVWGGVYEGVKPRLEGVDLDGDALGAFSLEVRLVDSEGTLVYRTFGGLALDHLDVEHDYVHRATDPWFWSAARTEQALSVALRQLPPREPSAAGRKGPAR